MTGFQLSGAIRFPLLSGAIFSLAAGRLSLVAVLLSILLSTGPHPAAADERARKCVEDENNWCMQQKNYAATRYSTLDQINSKNARDLRMAWSFSTGVLGGHEGSPLVIGSMMYLHTPFPNVVYALNLDDENRIVWKYQPTQDANLAQGMCCEGVNRGLQYADGKLFLYQADTTLVALNPKTGQVIWKAQNGDPARGETGTGAVLVAGKVVIAGVSGGDQGARGFITGYDINSGQRLWRAYSSGPDAQTLFNPEKTTVLGKPVGANSGNPGGALPASLPAASGLGGGAPWGWFSWDPKLNLFYYGTGSPALGAGAHTAGSDAKWTSSIIARRPQTGDAVWAYQLTPSDVWGFDGVNEMILIDEAQIGGEKRDVLVHFDRNGFAYTIDRATGMPLVAERFDVAVNWASEIDLDATSPTFGRPKAIASLSELKTDAAAQTAQVCPASLGSKNQQPAAYSPMTKLFYVPASHVCMNFAVPAAAAAADAGEAAEKSGAAGEGQTPQPAASEASPPVSTAPVAIPGPPVSMSPPKNDTHMGNLIAWDAVEGKAVWSNKEQFPIWSGVLTTAGGIACYGTLEGDFKCVDQKDGRELFRNRTPSGIVGNVFTYAHKGKQYIGVLSGIGGLPGLGIGSGRYDAKRTEQSPLAPALSGLRNYTAQGGSLTVWALP
ncbi:Methanol dehydrogenase large subunit protein [Hyphomicrobium sulfonivorans]|uniref:Methanol dehydrogenase large subunit protein n=1 Tax=Hyphomicrobium sulfonivorans TaxID=121290 RepID=A0A109BIJ5_HYPSL|nr:PQQ-dependent dehydrogenase, methanol/ethanol family [Hyphomicrobium sulfonivorans]KWT69473.1 Methanol dehydrogenase large subunit protein [Hyphomicrobium sulfonivorans]